MERSFNTYSVSMCLAGIVLAGLAILFVWLLSTPRQLPGEPVYVRTKGFPVLGHIIGMMRGSNHHLEKIALVITQGGHFDER